MLQVKYGCLPKEAPVPQQVEVGHPLVLELELALLQAQLSLAMLLRGGDINLALCQLCFGYYGPSFEYCLDIKASQDV